MVKAILFDIDGRYSVGHRADDAGAFRKMGLPVR